MITAGFLQGGLFHFLMNTWVLFDLGPVVEEAYGLSRMVVIYFVGTVAGFYLSAMWSPAVSIGASAGIFALIGALIAWGAQHRSMMGQMVKSHYSRWAIYGLLMGLLPGFNIDNAAHLGGLGAGLLIAKAAGTHGYSITRERIWQFLCYLCVILTAFAFFEMFMAFQQLALPVQKL